MGTSHPVRYHPYYCEENARWLCADSALGAGERRVVFISNETRSVLLAHQRAGGGDGRVVWDYHVICLAADPGGGWQVWDLDTTLGMPVGAALYLSQTFSRRAPPELRPRFRVIDAARFRETFSTDRSHMRIESGGYQQPPPPWDPPRVEGVSTNLMRFLEMEGVFEGELMDLDDLVGRYGSSG